MKNFWLARKGGAQIALSTVEGFAIGLSSKFIAATVCYPITRVKVMAIAQSKQKKGEKAKSGFEIASEVYQKDGFAGFYYGLEGQVSNAALKYGLNMMIKERIQLLLYWLLLPEKLHLPTATS